MSSAEHARIAQAAQALALPISDEQIDRLIGFVDLLERWNRTYNLTSVRQRDDMLVQHIFDCLAVVGPLRHAEAQGPVRRCLDVGSGGGLPSVVIAVMRPDIHVVSVDTVGKKATFVRQVALELGLRNLAAEHARVEALRTEAFDVVTSRAFASLHDFTMLTQPLVAPTGVWMAMKGQPPVEEIAALPPTIDVFHVEQLTVPNLDAERCIVWMRPRTEAA